VSRAWAFCACLCLAVPAQSAAQGADTPASRPGHLTIAGGLTWLGGYPIGDSQAALRSNATGATPPPFTLFRADTSVDAAVGAEVRAGIAVTPSFTIEGGFTISRPSLTVVLSDDAEAASATLDAERLSQLTIDGGVVWQLPGPIVGRKLRPFVTAGGGYLRQLYDERTMVETGRIVYAGGGARYWLRGGDGSRRAVGLRGDVRAMWRTDGVNFEDKTRVGPTLSIMLFWEM
jgi:hypothetical protein